MEVESDAGILFGKQGADRQDIVFGVGDGWILFVFYGVVCVFVAVFLWYVDSVGAGAAGAVAGEKVEI
jgi:hypothetical protein